MAERITGHTLLISLLATPIRHSLSPTMQNEAFAKLGLDYAYLAFEVGNDELEDAIKGIRALGIQGSNVSMPNKKEVIKYLDDLSDAARMAGAVNTIVNDNGKLIGHITDGTGFMRGLRDADVNIVGEKATICGAGGAATAICIQAALDGVKELAIYNRNDEHFNNALETAKKIQAKTNCIVNVYDLEDTEQFKRDIESSKIFINATGVGMKPLEDQSLINDPTLLRKDLVVADVVYVPSETKLLKMAREQGCKTINGIGMMLWQGAAAFELWTKQEMPVDYIRKIMFEDK